MLTFKFDTFPIIETQRMILRQVRITDVDEIYQLRNDTQTVEFTARPPFESKKEAVELIEKMLASYASSDGLSWSITIKGEDKVIGGVGFWRFEREHFRAEIGYSLLPAYWNLGYMSEAILPVIDFGFEHVGIHSIEANLNPHNIASEKILLKAGFVKEGYFKENYYFNGKFDDTLTYGLVKPR
jgi:ribosomal-protein-alanine N-acetyltransferase